MQGELLPVAGGDFVEPVMGSPAAQPHGELCFFDGKLILAVADDRPRGQDVIEWGQPVAATGAVIEREILAVSVGRSE